MRSVHPKLKKHILNSSSLIALTFLCVILLGTLLLCLPAASRSGVSCGVRTALFTATSASCVTGLILADTWTQWSGFGQAVLLCLIEIGGLGFMSAASLVLFALRKKLSMSQKLVISQSIGLDDAGDAVRLQHRLLAGSLLIEAAGAVILTLRFLSRYGLARALQLGIFHSVSAFCNAGFDIFGFERPGCGLSLYGTDPVVCLTLCALIILGGLGFFVWDEVLRIRSPKRWSVYTKLVLIMTAVLTVVGAALIYFAERGNPATLGALSPVERLLASLFQSVTTRTAGFAGIDQGALTEPGKAVTIFLMLIGGSSGSTAGGLKTVTFVVLLLFLRSRVRGESEVCVFSRTVPAQDVLNALALFGLMVCLSFLGGAVICADSPVGLTDALYEAVSALATVGLTTGITPQLGLPAQLLLIIYMYFGRVGLLTISAGFLRGRRTGDKFRYARASLLIG